MYSVYYIHDVMGCIEPVVCLKTNPFFQLLVENKLEFSLENKLEFSLMLFVLPANKTFNR